MRQRWRYAARRSEALRRQLLRQMRRAIPACAEAVAESAAERWQACMAAAMVLQRQRYVAMRRRSAGKRQLL